MQNQPGIGGGIRRSAYIFLAGLGLGIIVGWMMHGLIGVIFRIAIFIIAVVIVALALSFWQSTRRQARDTKATVDVTWQDRRDTRSR